VGAVSSKAAIMVDCTLYAYSIMRTGASSPDSANEAVNWALEGTGMKLDDIHYVVGTGYGRVNVPFANKAITEITCHARGANYIWGPTGEPYWIWGVKTARQSAAMRRVRLRLFL